MPSGCKSEDVSSNPSSDGVLVVKVKKPEAQEIQISQEQK